MTTRVFSALAIAFCLGLVLSSCHTAPSSTTQTGRHPVYRLAEKSVLAIGGEDGSIEGSCFLVRYQGKPYLATSFHVVSRLRQPFVQDAQGRRFPNRVLLGVDRLRDLAVLSAAGLPGDLAPLSLADGCTTSQTVFLVGFPVIADSEPHLNFEAGFVSDSAFQGPVFVGRGKMDYIQFTAAINLGHSGSPLLDDRGRVLGVVAWRFDPTSLVQGGNYAVPARLLAALLELVHREAILPERSPPTCQMDSDCRWLDFCIEGHCRTLLSEGEGCSLDNDCLAPLRCIRSVCQYPRPAGQACREDGECQAPMVCILGQCRELGSQTDTCGHDRDCLQPLICLEGRCRRERSGPGGPCSSVQHCRWPLACSAGICSSVQGLSCRADSECAPLFCINEQCADLGQLDEACRQDADCLLPLVCRQGRCQQAEAAFPLPPERLLRNAPAAGEFQNE